MGWEEGGSNDLLRAAQGPNRAGWREAHRKKRQPATVSGNRSGQASTGRGMEINLDTGRESAAASAEKFPPPPPPPIHEPKNKCTYSAVHPSPRRRVQERAGAPRAEPSVEHASFRGRSRRHVGPRERHHKTHRTLESRELTAAASRFDHRHGRTGTRKKERKKEEGGEGGEGSWAHGITVTLFLGLFFFVQRLRLVFSRLTFCGRNKKDDYSSFNTLHVNREGDERTQSRGVDVSMSEG